MSRRRGVQGCSGGRETPSPLFMEKPLSTMHPDGQRLAARVGEGRVREEVDGCPGLTLLARTFWGIFQRDITWMQGTRASGSLSKKPGLRICCEGRACPRAAEGLRTAPLGPSTLPCPVFPAWDPAVSEGGLMIAMT